MVRWFLLLAGASAVLTGLLFIAVNGLRAPSSDTSGPVAPVPEMTTRADPPPVAQGYDTAVGGPLVPLPSPAPAPAPAPETLTHGTTVEGAVPPVVEPAAPPPVPPAPSVPEQRTVEATPPPDPSKAADAPAPPDPANAPALPAGSEVIFDQPKMGGKRLWTGCTKFKSYNAATETYRGLDGRLHSCKLN